MSDIERSPEPIAWRPAADNRVSMFVCSNCGAEVVPTDKGVLQHECPISRTFAPTAKEVIERLQERVEALEARVAELEKGTQLNVMVDGPC